MTQYQSSQARPSCATAGMLAVWLSATVSLAYEPTQSGGTGTHQGEDASMSTKRGGNTGPHTGRNEHSGSATGAVRDPKQSEPAADKDKGSHQMGSQSSHEAKTGDNEGRGKGGARTSQ